MDSKFDGAIYALVSRLGWSYSSKTIADLRERLKAEEFFIDESGAIVSPSGESLGSAVGRLWEEGPPPGANSGASAASTSEDAERARFGGFLKADLPTLSHETRLAVMMGADAPRKVDPYISARPAAPVSIAEITQRTGISAKAFNAMLVDRKLAIEDAVKRLRSECDPDRKLALENHVKRLAAGDELDDELDDA
jgi:hypothetical protein